MPPGSLHCRFFRRRCVVAAVVNLSGEKKHLCQHGTTEINQYTHFLDGGNALLRVIGHWHQHGAMIALERSECVLSLLRQLFGSTHVDLVQHNDQRFARKQRTNAVEQRQLRFERVTTELHNFSYAIRADISVDIELSERVELTKKNRRSGGEKEPRKCR